jgi:ribosomal-protein-alanine acetyltransferase
MIRPLASADADAVLAVQGACPQLAQWSKRDYEELTQHAMVGWVASPQSAAPSSEAPSIISGFLTARQAADEIEILNLCVIPAERCQGIGRALLQTALAWAAEHHARRAFLEVRASNQPAIHFYSSFGFEQTGRRPKYYAAPVEDALQLAAQLS